MTCRHERGDRRCSSHPDNVARRQAEYQAEKERQADLAARTPDKARYEIEDSERVGPHLVLKVRYPNCTKCSFEGQKVMVFLDVTEAQVLRWKEIDPHFRDPTKQPARHEAPSPAARFPASPEGWQDALAYAFGKMKKD